MLMLWLKGITLPTLSLKWRDYLLGETKMIFCVTYFTTCLTPVGAAWQRVGPLSWPRLFDACAVSVAEGLE